MHDLAPFTGFGDDTNISLKFGILAPGGIVPLWTLDPRISSMPIPHSNRTVKQYGGLGEWSVTFSVDIETTQDLEMLQMLQGLTATLRYQHGVTNRPGGTVSTIQDVSYVILPDTFLARVSNESRLVDDTCEASVTFTRPAEASPYYGFAIYAEDE
jgi:hypothetical protein